MVKILVFCPFTFVPPQDELEYSKRNRSKVRPDLHEDQIEGVIEEMNEPDYSVYLKCAQII